MNHCTAGQLAEIRRQELTADAAYYQQGRRRRGQSSTRPRNHPRGPLKAFQTWLAAGQL